MSNAIANVDQFTAERDVTRMWRSDAVKRARATVASHFELAHGRDTPDEARSTFGPAIDEFIGNFLFKAAASDAAHPRFVRNFMPAYNWHGHEVPGARAGGDNPDNCYRLAGIAHGGRYRVTGRPTGPRPAHASFTLTGNYAASVTIQTIESTKLTQATDGSFVITIDDQAAAGRPNHLTTAPHAKFLFVRESFDDWAAECPFELTIERLDATGMAPQTADEMAAHAAFRAVEEVPLFFWFQRLSSALPVNSIRPPVNAGSMGGLVTQAAALGWYHLQPEQAVLLRYQPSGAAYVSAALGDWWYRSLDAHRQQSSLTRAQSVVDADGWISLVIARRDPGVANWLDTGDLSTVLFWMRWQGLPFEPVAGGPKIESQLLTLDTLPKVLKESQSIDSHRRGAKILTRCMSWHRRIVE